MSTTLDNSDTPRTDAMAQTGALDDHEVVDASFARQLERELGDLMAAIREGSDHG